jgi:menaquinone-specific isochorismate synthase
LRRELLENEKERREQALVVEDISRSLAPLCDDLRADEEPSVLRLAFGQHLVTKFRATLREETGDADLLQNLHPTAAVGGVPTEKALRAIARLEPFDRGWYAGPVGWVTRDCAQFAVGIRSALVFRNSLHLFAGAGIVKGSSAQNEWAEVENKVSDFLALLEDHEPEPSGRHQQPLG